MIEKKKSNLGKGIFYFLGVAFILAAALVTVAYIGFNLTN